MTLRTYSRNIGIKTPTVDFEVTTLRPPEQDTVIAGFLGVVLIRVIWAVTGTPQGRSRATSWAKTARLGRADHAGETGQVSHDMGLVIWPKRGTIPSFKRYLSTTKGKPVADMIDDISPINSQARERTGYPTQKPLALLNANYRSIEQPW